jgi:hypothetical protein
MRTVGGSVLKPVRTILQFEATLTLAALIAAYWFIHANWVVFIVLLLSPDVAMLGYLRDTRFGARCYNAFHTFAAPLIVAALSLKFPMLLPFSLIWAAHIAMDRALGYGLKYSDSFSHTHLGLIGHRGRADDCGGPSTSSG